MLHLGLRSAAPFPLYDADAIAVRIQEALESRGSATAAPLRALRGRDSSEPGTLTLALVGTTTPSPDVNARSVALVRPTEMVIARAHRWTPAELPWVCSVQAPSGLDARVINVSRSGILIESGSKLMPGSVAGVHLCGPGTALVVPARVVRSEVASIDVAGVKYLIAAAFDGRLDPLPEQSAVQSPLSSMPRTPAELRVRVAAEVDHSQRPADITVIDEDVRELTSAYHMKDGEDFRLLEAAAVSAVRVLKDDARRLRNAW
jgi:hypothetical protein